MTLSKKTLELLDTVFPQPQLTEEDWKLVSNDASMAKVVRLHRDRTSNANGRPQAFTDFSITSLDPRSPLSKSLAESDLSEPVTLCLSGENDGTIYAADYAERYAIAIAQCAPEAYGNDTDDVSVLCLAACDIFHNTARTDAIERLIEDGRAKLAYGDMKAMGAHSYKVDGYDFYNALEDHQMIKAAMMRPRTRGSIMWFGDVPDDIICQRDALMEKVHRDNFLARLDHILFPLFVSHATTDKQHPRSPKEEQRIATSLVNILSCGTLAIDERIFETDAADAYRKEEVQISPIMRYIGEHMSFSSYKTARKSEHDGLDEDQTKKLGDIVTCWDKVVTSDFRESHLPVIGSARGDGMYAADLPAIERLADEYEMFPYISAVMRGMPLDDLMLDDIQKSNQERLRAEAEAEKNKKKEKRGSQHGNQGLPF